MLAFVVMPSHFHWVFRPLESWVKEIEADVGERSRARGSCTASRRFTGRECNLRLRETGAFWQQESYDHWVRDAEELERIINYVEYNPVKAGLVSEASLWQYGSAKLRQTLGLEFGAPLPRLP